MRLKAVIEYEGSGFSGWQVQPRKVTVQGEMEKAILQITGEEVRITGAGRTDAGVHALGQVASWLHQQDILADKLRTALNSVLPQSIYIKSLEEAHDGFHARRDALSKTYRYTILKGRSPLRSRRVWELDYPLDIVKMRQAARMLEGEHDYAAFCKVEDHRTSIKVDSVTVEELGDEIIIDVRGPAFLYKMVRRMVGVIAECGRGKLEPVDIGRLFEETSNIQTVTAPARGLVLVEVKY